MPIRSGIEITEEDAIEYDELMEKSAYYDRIQMANKLALNSAYGALCNKYFRFYDLRLAASTTGTGQELLKHQTRKVNEILTGNYELSGGNVVSGDTDSLFCDTIIKYNNNLEDTVENLFNFVGSTHIGTDKEYSYINGTFDVLTYDHDSNTALYEEALCIYRHKVSKEQWEIEDQFSNQINITGDHSVMIERNGELIEVKPRDILDTDLLITIEEIE